MHEGLLFPELTEEFAAAAQRLRVAKRVAVVTHIKPDADAVGSACGLAAGLKTLGIDARVYIGQPFPHPANLAHIPGVDEISYSTELPQADLIVATDCASVDRTGAFSPFIEADNRNIVVIDHHETNPGYGQTNLIVVSESTTMLVRELFAHLGVKLDSDIAHCLYAGLITDTGNFRWGTQRMHLLAAELIGFGLDTRGIALQLMDAMTGEDLRLLGEVLAGMERHRVSDHDVCVFTISCDVLQEMNQVAVEAIIDYARALEGSDIGVVLKEQRPQSWSVSLRSSSVDVSLIAQRLGGGGHIPAAGLNAHGPRDEVLQRILGEV